MPARSAAAGSTRPTAAHLPSSTPQRFEEGTDVEPTRRRAVSGGTDRGSACGRSEGCRRRPAARLGGTFFEPTVVTGGTPRMGLFREEIFGPVAAVVRCRDEAEMTAMANDTPFGLAGYVYGRDVSRVWRTAEALDWGIVGCNTDPISTEVAPLGGMRKSCHGRGLRLRRGELSGGEVPLPRGVAAAARGRWLLGRRVVRAGRGTALRPAAPPLPPAPATAPDKTAAGNA